jgi:hypothetical protein
MRLSIFKTYQVFILAAVTVCTLSCKKFVDIGSPDGTVPAEAVFKEDASATAAVLAIYSNNNYRDHLLYGTYYSGSGADEIVYNLTDEQIDFQNNSLRPASNYVLNYMWFFPYRQIVNTNICVTGLTNSTTLTPSVKNQLLGESKFWRALTYFQLVNLFGDVPYSTSDQPLDLALLPRTSKAAVMTNVINDLKEAKALLTPSYPTVERARVNQYAVSALLARVYLYQKEWANAESEATAVIASNVYSMSAPANTFIKTSNETILQVANINGFTNWGSTFVPATATNTPNWYLRNTFTAAFETGDLRKANWTGAIGTTGNLYINKYKLRTGTAGNEYYVVLRLAEQYLIRAEARAQQDKVSGTTSAEADLNVVRGRAGIGNLTGLNKATALVAIEKERKVELFAEWFHRWFDLKRTAGFSDANKSRADEILSALKGANWQSSDALYPIPATEIVANPNLTPNPGY